MLPKHPYHRKKHVMGFPRKKLRLVQKEVISQKQDEPIDGIHSVPPHLNNTSLNEFDGKFDTIHINYPY